MRNGLRVEIDPAGELQAGGVVTGTFALRMKHPDLPGGIEVALVGIVQGAQRKTDVRLHEEVVTLSQGAPIAEVTRWAFRFQLPPGPPSHDGGGVSVVWKVVGTLVSPDGHRASRSATVRVSAPGTPPPNRAAIRARNMLGRLEVAWARAFTEAARLGVSFAWLGAVPAVYLLAGPAQALGVFLFVWLPLLYYAVPFARWYVPDLAAGLRAVLVPGPGPIPALRLGESAPLRLDPRYAWSFVRCEDAASVERRFLASTPGWVTSWHTHATVLVEGRGPGTVTIPADAPPTLSTRTRRIRWEIRVFDPRDPRAVRRVPVEVLPWRI